MIWSTDDDIPTQWPKRPLSELTSKVGSGATPRGGATTYLKSGVPFIRSQNVRFEGFSYAGLAFLSEAQAKQLDNVTVEAGDVLLNITGASIGRVSIAPEDMSGARVNQHVCIIRSKGQVLPSFLASYLSAPQIQDAIAVGNYGVTREALTKSQILEIPVPVLGLPEQRALVSELDAIAAKRLSSLTHVRAANRAIKRFRQAALMAAWREASEGSPAIRLEELLAEPMRNGYSARPVNAVTPFRVLTLSATTSGWFDEQHFKYTAEKFDRSSPFWVRPGDILVQRGNTADYVGVPALYEGQDHQFLYPDLMIRVRVRPELGARYVWYMLLSPRLRDLVRSQATGSAGNMPKVNQKNLNEILIPVPDNERRAKIVSRLDRVLGIAERLTKRTKMAMRQTERSSQAVLAKAFRGELIGAES